MARVQGETQVVLLVGDGPCLRDDRLRPTDTSPACGGVAGEARRQAQCTGAFTQPSMRTGSELQRRVVEAAALHGGRRAYVWLRPDGGAIAAVDGLPAARAVARHLGLVPDVLGAHIDERTVVLVFGCSDPGPQRAMILALVQLRTGTV